MHRILITGGRGMLGSDLSNYLTEICHYDVQSFSHQELDVTNTVCVNEALKSLNPNVVIHTAALHVDPCQENPFEAFRVNTWATKTLARACQIYNTTFLYISTCGLFGDKIRAYSEYDPVTLKTVYAHSKYEGEILTRQFCERYFIIRPGWLFGGSIHHEKNFVIKRYQEAVKTPVIRSVFDKYGSPTSTTDLAKGIAQILKTQEYGTFHIVNQGSASRAQYVRHIVECFGLSTQVEEVDSSYFPRKANIPDCEILDSFNIQFLGIDALPHWEEAIARYIRKIRQM